VAAAAGPAPRDVQGATGGVQHRRLQEQQHWAAADLRGAGPGFGPHISIRMAFVASAIGATIHEGLCMVPDRKTLHGCADDAESAKQAIINIRTIPISAQYQCVHVCGHTFLHGTRLWKSWSRSTTSSAVVAFGCTLQDPRMVGRQDDRMLLSGTCFSDCLGRQTTNKPTQ